MRVREIRTSKGISVPKLSAMTGIHRRTLEDLEKRGDCLVSTALKISEALGVTMDELCANETRASE